MHRKYFEIEFPSKMGRTETYIGKLHVETKSHFLGNAQDFKSWEK